MRGTPRKRFNLADTRAKKRTAKVHIPKAFFRSPASDEHPQQCGDKKHFMIGQRPPRSNEAFPLGGIGWKGVSVRPRDGSRKKGQFDPSPDRQRRKERHIDPKDGRIRQGKPEPVSPKEDHRQPRQHGCFACGRTCPICIFDRHQNCTGGEPPDKKRNK